MPIIKIYSKHFISKETVFYAQPTKVAFTCFHVPGKSMNYSMNSEEETFIPYL